MKLTVILLLLLWGNVEFTLTLQECSVLPSVKHAFVLDEYKKAEYQKGDVIYFCCDPGYTTGLNTTYICTERGWSGVIYSQCVEDTFHLFLACTPPPPLTNGYVLQNSTLVFENGQNVGFRCHEFHTMRGRPYKTCTNGQWTGDIQCLKRCDVGVLPDNLAISPGGVQHLLEGQSLAFQCKDQRHMLHGSALVKCLNDGQWNQPFPSCLDCTLEHFKRMSSFDDTVDLSILRSAYLKGETVRVHCKIGYRGSFTLICTQDGWVKIGDKCRPISCGPPEDAPFATVQLVKGWHYDFGSQILYTCDTGYQMASYTATRNCLQEGWDGHVPVCEPIPCPPLIVNDNLLVHGNISQPEFGTVLQFSCRDKNHKLLGPAIIFCNEIGQWSNNPPLCQEH